MKRLAIVTTHPIQYNAPWFKLLSQRKNVIIKVFYTWSQSNNGSKYDPGFGKNIEWDIPLLEGYPYEFVPNTSLQPGTRHHKGIQNPELITSIIDFKPEAVLINGWNFDSHLKAIRYFHRKIPVFFRGDSTLLDRRNPVRDVIKKIVLRQVFKNIDKALYVGIENKKYFEVYGLRKQQLVFVPHAIDNQRFEIAGGDTGAINLFRENNCIPSSAFVFLFAGKLEPKKDPEILVQAFKKIQKANTYLLIVGNGELENTLRESCQEWPGIIFINFQNQSQMPAVYGMADVVILPSKGPGETWGLAINEAMACSKAVIVSDKCGCASNLVQNGNNGYVFPSGDMNALAQKMQIFLQDNKQKAREMGLASRAIIVDYSFDRIVLAIEKIMETI